MDDNRLLIWGSGGTLRTIGEMVGIKPTVLGIDASIGSEQIGTDLNESDLLELLSEHDGEVTILLSPMGGQGLCTGMEKAAKLAQVGTQIGCTLM